MCGIVGYVGRRSCAGLLVDALKTLEYRGYDSTGVAFFHDGIIETVKAAGRIQNLESKMESRIDVETHCGIGHTRWATHGGPTDENAHPHSSEHISLLHNGIIENYQELKAFLIEKGYTFLSQTDTETAAHLMDYYYKETGDFLEAVIRALHEIRGTYAFGIICKDEPGKIICVRQENPLLLGLGEGENFMASDIPAFIKYTKKYLVMEPGEIAILEADRVSLVDFDKNPIEKEPLVVTWDYEAAEKGGYPHFMLQAIHETPSCLRATMSPRVQDGLVRFDEKELPDHLLRDARSITILACGSAMHAGMVAKYGIEKLCRVKVDVEVASEFRGRPPLLTKDDLVIVISQSGETLDTLAALKMARACGAKILSIVNVVGSSIARESDYVVYTWTGPEIAVATTKAYSAQLAAMDALAVEMARVRGAISADQFGHLLEELSAIPDKIRRILEDKERLQWFSSKIANAHDIFFIGRGLDYAISLEGSLKMKEISYIHSEAYAAGELKHGTISLIENNTLVIGVLTQSQLFEKTVSNMVECKSRGAYLMGITTNGNFAVEDSVNFTVYVPRTDEHFVSSLAVIPLQLLAYYTSVNRGLDVDKPRNLAKSVTVE
jgi:glucosamine--fructose-6-phosphate aminotransferase (isomerizing)